MATLTVQVCSPATRHAEFVAPELAATERVQDCLDPAAEMRSHSHAALFQLPQKRFGQRSTEQHVHFEFSHTPRECVLSQRAEQHFPPLNFCTPSECDNQQARGCIEQR